MPARRHVARPEVAHHGNASEFGEHAAIADLPGAHAVLTDDVSSGVSNPVLVLLTGSQDTLVTVSDALGATLPSAE